MKLLLDTHTFLWFIEDNPRMSQHIRTLLSEKDEVFLSSASLWEIAIKLSIGKLSISATYDEFIPKQLNINRIEVLHIKVSHLAVVSRLPFHHRDPFDRLMIAQALVEQLPIASADSVFEAYQVIRVW